VKKPEKKRLLFLTGNMSATLQQNPKMSILIGVTVVMLVAVGAVALMVKDVDYMKEEMSTAILLAGVCAVASLDQMSCF